VTFCESSSLFRVFRRTLLITSVFVNSFQEIFGVDTLDCEILYICFSENYFGQNFKFWPKIQNMVKNSNRGEKFKIWPKFKFWSKIQILVKNSNFGEKFKSWSKIQILVNTLIAKYYIFRFPSRLRKASGKI